MWIRLVLMVSLLNLLVSFSSCLPQSACNDYEKSALLQFKASFLMNPACDSSAYTNLSSWEETADCCTWTGVECGGGSGGITGLDLTNSCLYGSINSSSSLFLLIHLKGLNLSFNNFNNSTIPYAIRNLSMLTHLNLSVSSFSNQIPSGILELSELVSLDLSGNPLKLQKPGLKDLVERLTNLANLQLTGVIISSQVPPSLANLSSLSSLSLRDCKLQGEFPVETFRLPNLRSLNLRFNPDLTGYLPEFGVGSPIEMLRLEDTSFSGQLPSSIGNLKSLNCLVASGCQFSGFIPSSLGNLTKLQFLDLSQNQFSGQIPSSLSNLQQLTYLSLSFNNFSVGTLSWLGNLTNLYFLDLADTNLYGEIPFSFRNLTQLTYLWLYSNALSGQVPTWLGNLTQSIRLSDNLLHGSISESIFEVPNLQELELRFNRLSGNLRFDSVLKATNLVSLQLSANHLSLIGNSSVNLTMPKFEMLGLRSCNLTEFPNFLEFQDKLEFLDLAQNKIQGNIPNWISNLGPETLGILNLASNFLTGFEQPFLVLPWINLYVLNLTSNNLQGSLPTPPLSIFVYLISDNKLSSELSPMICNLTSLMTLDVSNNNLSGKLPPCFADFINSVSVLNLRNNSFSGKIPDSYTSDCALQMIDLSQNKLEGKIPRSLTNCTDLETLNLGNNKINDIFPSWLGVLADLMLLILRSNELHGAIGKLEANSEFPHLQIIDLSDNNFTGKLPMEYFQNWKAMRTVDKKRLQYIQANTSFQILNYSWSNYYPCSITMRNKGIDREYERVFKFLVAVDLSSNKFDGEIPEAIGNLRELLLLNLSNNALAGHIPSSLGNLKELEALDLSMNNLSGNIPTQLAQLSFLAFFNVSNNHLSGPTPRGNQFDTFENNSYFSNLGLCGTPLSKKCEASPLTPPSSENEEGSGASFEFGWKVVVMGYAIGLIIGVVIEGIVNTRQHKWLANSGAVWQVKVRSLKRRLW